jgi:hypothetical protein
MRVEEQIEAYLAAQPAQKRSDMQALHRLVLRAGPGCRLWFLDGRNGEGKTVSNPNIGYGHQSLPYAGGKTRDFYRIGMSANTAGISLYIIGLEDRTCLARTWGHRLGKASVTGYCIRFRALGDLDPATLEEIVRFGLEAPEARSGHA